MESAVNRFVVSAFTMAYTVKSSVSEPPTWPEPISRLRSTKASPRPVTNTARTRVPDGTAETYGEGAGFTCSSMMRRACSVVLAPYGTSRSTATRRVPSDDT